LFYREQNSLYCNLLVAPVFQIRRQINVEAVGVESGGVAEKLIHDIEVVASGAVPGCILNSPEITPFGAVNAYKAVVGPS